MSTETGEAGVLASRRLKFERVGRGYAVYAVKDALANEPLDPTEPYMILLGVAQEESRSTDRKIAGTRLIRHGLGAKVWRARLPAENAMPTRWLSHTRGDGYVAVRFERDAENWDRRQDAGLALAAWYDLVEEGAAVERCAFCGRTDVEFNDGLRCDVCRQEARDE